MSLSGFSFVAGRRGGAGGAVFRAIDPAETAVLEPEFHTATPAEIEAAMQAAQAAAPIFAGVSPEARAAFLEQIATEIEALGAELLERAALETALPLKRLEGERARTCGQLRLFAQTVREGSWVDARIDPALPARTPLPRSDLRRMLVPIGPVIVFGSSNFPLAFSVAGGDTASAFAAGCAVVVKAHEAHPGTSELAAGAIVRAAAHCGLPAGVFSLLQGDGRTVGIALVQHPAAAAVGFTGSQRAGRAIVAAGEARARPIPVFAEMSSLNPVYLLPGVVAERGAALAQGLLNSFTLGVGQFCTKPGLVFLQAGADAEAFLKTLAAAVSAAAPLACMLTPSIRRAFEEHRAAVSALPGIRVLSDDHSAAAVPSGRATVVTVDAGDFLRQPTIATEVFGPFTVVVVAKDLPQMRACAESLDGQLTGTIHGNAADLAGAADLFGALERRVGRLIINGFPTGVEVCPAMNHGGPFPATSDVRFTSVGTAALLRFARPLCYQDVPEALLPAALRNANPLGIMRLVNGTLTRDAI